MVKYTAVIFEYAGFKFYIIINSAGDVVDAVPLPGQHYAAQRDRHRRAAMESYGND